METKIVTKQGAVQGLLSQDGRTVIFRGVPYAQPPVGELRFRRPQAHQPWEGVRDCTQFGPRCPQADLASMDFYGREFYDDLVPPGGRGLPVPEHLDPGGGRAGEQAAGAVLDSRRGVYARLLLGEGV